MEKSRVISGVSLDKTEKIRYSLNVLAFIETASEQSAVGEGTGNTGAASPYNKAYYLKELPQCVKVAF